MMVRSSFGRCSLPTKLARFAFIGCFAASTATAKPMESYPDSVAKALATVEAAWADSVLAKSVALESFDEQIFTDISPILDSPIGIKLPEDQLLTD